MTFKPDPQRSVTYPDQTMEDDDFDDEDEDVSIAEIFSRAQSHFKNEELAHEAATKYPGDFI